MVGADSDIAGAREPSLTQCSGDSAAGLEGAPPSGSGRVLLRTTAQAGEMACAVDKRAITLPLDGVQEAPGTETNNACVAAAAAVAAEVEEGAEAEELCASLSAALSAAAQDAVTEALTSKAESAEGDVDVSWVLDHAEHEADKQSSSGMQQTGQSREEVLALESTKAEAGVEPKASSDREAASLERTPVLEERRGSESSSSILEAAMAVASEVDEKEHGMLPETSSNELPGAAVEEKDQKTRQAQLNDDTADGASEHDWQPVVVEQEDDASSLASPDDMLDCVSTAGVSDDLQTRQALEHGGHHSSSNGGRSGHSTAAAEAISTPRGRVLAAVSAIEASKNGNSPNADSSVDRQPISKQEQESEERTEALKEVALDSCSPDESGHDRQHPEQQEAALRLASPVDHMTDGAATVELRDDQIQQEQDDMWTWMYGCGYVPDNPFEGSHSVVPAEAPAVKALEQPSRQSIADDTSEGHQSVQLINHNVSFEAVATHVDIDSPNKNAQKELSSLLADRKVQAELLARAETHARSEAVSAEKMKNHWQEEHQRAEHAEASSQKEAASQAAGAAKKVRDELQAQLLEERWKSEHWERLATRHEDSAENQRALAEKAQQQLERAECHAEELQALTLEESTAHRLEKDLAAHLFSESQAAMRDKHLFEEELRSAAEQHEEAMSSFEEQSARKCASYSGSEQQAKDEVVSLHQELLKREQLESVRQAQADQPGLLRCLRFCPGAGAGSRLSSLQDEARLLCTEFEAWTEKAEGREQEAASETAGAAAAAEQLEAMRHRLQEEQEMMTRDAYHAAQRRLEEDRQAELANSERELAAAASRREEEAVELRCTRMAARERCLIDDGGHGSRLSGLLVPDVPLAVRLPNFDAAPRIGASVSYNIIVEGPGATERLQRSYADFRELHEVLRAKPFASSLQALPQDWIFASFSTMMLERRRRHLEAYLAFLCTHAQVLLDTALWTWLGVDDLTQVVVRLVAARAVQWPAELSRLVETLEAVLAAGGDAGRCVHPAVLGVLRDVLMDFDDEVAQAAACRVLERLLVSSSRARQLFLATPNVTSPRSSLVSSQHGAAGLSALAAVCLNSSSGGPRMAAVTTLQHVLEALSMAVADAEARQSAAATEAEMAAAEVAAATAEGEAAGERRSEERSAAAARDGDGDSGECCVCLDRGRSHAFLPCGHLCTCMDCADYLAARGSPCPVCRRPIEQAVQIFI